MIGLRSEDVVLRARAGRADTILCSWILSRSADLICQTRPDKEAALRILMVPGYMGSGPEHWQTHWKNANPAIERVEQEDWARPERSAWVSRLDEYLGNDPDDTILVAHSLGCSTVAAWAAQNTGSSVAGALLVAPADLDRIDLIAELRPFGPMPLNRLPFKSIVVASDNDPWVSLDRARYFADRWGSTLIPIGAGGHINSDAGFGPWPEGKAILAKLLQEVSS